MIRFRIQLQRSESVWSAGVDFILEDLAIGSAEDARQPPPEITAMLCVAEEVVPPDRGRVSAKIPVVDMEPIPIEQMRMALTWLRQHIPGHRALVYCNAGVGRSTSVVVGYLCCIRGYGFGEAVELIARRRPYMSILPNLLLTIEACSQSNQR